MTEKDTKKFVERWNKKNGFPTGVTQMRNMRVGEGGKIFWNAYDSPEVDVEQFVRIYQEVINKVEDKKSNRQ